MKSAHNYCLLTAVAILIALNYGFSQGNEKQDNSYIIVFLTTKSNENLTEEEIQVVENNHLRNIGRLSENKILANAGPFEGGGEIMLLNLNTRDEAETLITRDPLVMQGLATYEILDFEIRSGGVCDPAFPFEMKTYEFVRFSPTNQIANYKTNSDFDMKRLHDRYLNNLSATGNVVIEGIFEGNDGGILIYKSASSSINIQNDPAIREGYLTAESRRVWLNKGSFCDK